jgi:hypothetical protein
MGLTQVMENVQEQQTKIAMALTALVELQPVHGMNLIEPEQLHSFVLNHREMTEQVAILDAALREISAVLVSVPHLRPYTTG